MLFYVFVYTIWLKPRSPQNIVIGGAAGAVPVLVGWAAVTGELAAPAWVLFAIVFFWTPPHFWALSLQVLRRLQGRRHPDAAGGEGHPRRGAPDRRLRVRRGRDHASRCPLVTDDVGVGLPRDRRGARRRCSSRQAIRLARDTTPAQAIRLFTFSNTYLALLFAAVAVDTLLRSV